MSSPNDSINKMIESYGSIEELRAYANAQNKTILKLTKKVTELELELEDIEKNGLPESATLTNIPNLGAISDQEAICLIELHRLRNASMRDELTMEECKKVETYVRTLLSIRDKVPKEQPKAMALDTAELMLAMDNVLKIHS